MIEYSSKEEARAALSEIMQNISKRLKMEEEAESQLLALQISNAQKLYNLQLSYIKSKAQREIEENQAINEKLIRQGFDAELVLSNERLSLKRKEWEAARDAEKERLAGSSEKELNNALAIIDAQYAKKLQAEEAFQKKNIEMLDKIEKAREKEKEKDAKKRAKNDQKLAKETYGSLGNIIFGNLNGKTEEFLEKFKDAHPEYMENGELTAEGRKAFNSARTSAAMAASFDALAGWARKLEGTIEEIGKSKGEIDTRLQGLRAGKSWLGSYWDKMNTDIIRYVGMSPTVKQEDVTTNLKTLVGKGIAFNVEQRAFLETISAKIANTFEATDATLLKLVRIQQADTTAARLGMESALTAFLNNMYETTEYMTEAAADIRASIYEASALMGAAEATAFEYQVQKWMGSLYSVGFGSSSGLAEALGKLAAGDISGINEGGYSNLLIMAANKANLSIAEILAKGLDDSETNILMQAMVNYLADIYNETKGSKVVAQQFANVYGLTASDLKAAASLARSTTNIANNNLNYGGMMTQLTNTASTMIMRTSMGEIMGNLLGNLKYATSAIIAKDPILYATYEIASILDETVGGINIPAIHVWGNSVDLETTVANLMRVGAMGLGLLGGIGTMLTGIGNNMTAAGMLRGFGVTNGLTTTSRGSGSGLLTTSYGTTVSESGYIGNAEGSDVQNKVISDAQEDGQKQLAEAMDESEETKLSTVDEHIVEIYQLLRNVTLGIDSFHISKSGDGSWN